MKSAEINSNKPNSAAQDTAKKSRDIPSPRTSSDRTDSSKEAANNAPASIDRSEFEQFNKIIIHFLQKKQFDMAIAYAEQKLYDLGLKDKQKTDYINQIKAAKLLDSPIESIKNKRFDDAINYVQSKSDEFIELGLNPKDFINKINELRQKSAEKPVQQKHSDDTITFPALKQLIIDCSTADMRLSQIPKERAASKAFTAADKKLIDDARDKAGNLISKAYPLFEKAFLGNPPADSDIEMWRKFTSTLDLTKIDLRGLKILQNLENKNLDPNDRKLLYVYHLTKTNVLSGSEKEQLIKRLSERIIYHWNSPTLEYNGWNRGVRGDSFAFFDSLDSIEEGDFEKLLAEVFESNISKTLTIIKPEEAQKIVSANFSKKDLIKEMDQAEAECQKYPIGLQQKIDAFKRSSDLMALAIMKGISIKKYQIEKLRTSIPGIDEETAAILYKFGEAAGSSSKTDNNRLAKDFKAFLEAIQKQYINSKPNSTTRITFGYILHHLYALAPDFLSKKDIDKSFLDFDKQIQITNKVKVNKMSDLDKFKRSLAVGPLGLPAEVVDILKKTGYYDFVIKNIKEIIFTPEIEEGSSSPVEAGGEAMSFIGVVNIDIKTPDEKTVSARDVAHVLVHEAAHNEWHRNVPDPNLLRSTPNERNAFLTDSKFSEKYLAIFSPKDKEEREKIFSDIVSSKEAVRASNLAMGLPENLMDKTYALPSDQFVKSHNAKDIDDFDMENYPTNLASAFADGRLSEIMNVLNLGNNKDKIQNLIASILSGDNHIECSFKITGNSGFDKAKEIKYSLISKDGIQGNLAADEIVLLNTFFKKTVLFYNPNDKSHQNYSNIALAYMHNSSSANSRIFSSQILTEEISRQSLAKASKYNVLELLKDEEIDSSLKSKLASLYPKTIRVLSNGIIKFRLPALAGDDFNETFKITRKMIDDKNFARNVRDEVKKGNYDNPNFLISEMSLELYSALEPIKDKNTASALAWLVMVGIDKAIRENTETAVHFRFTSLELHLFFSSILLSKDARELAKDYTKNLSTSR